MDERDRDLARDEAHAPNWPAERQGRDGAVGAGDRLGPDDDDLAGGDPEARPSANQHSFAGEESATDAARTYHGRDGPI